MWSYTKIRYLDFVPLTTPAGGTAWVNPTLIAAVEPFDGGSRLMPAGTLVKGDPDEVIREIARLLKEKGGEAA
jgi:hypothetical protein